MAVYSMTQLDIYVFNSCFFMNYLDPKQRSSAIPYTGLGA